MARIFEYDVGQEALGQLLFELRRKINKLRQIFRSTESKLDILKFYMKGSISLVKNQKSCDKHSTRDRLCLLPLGSYLKPFISFKLVAVL